MHTKQRLCLIWLGMVIWCCPAARAGQAICSKGVPDWLCGPQFMGMLAADSLRPRTAVERAINNVKHHQHQELLTALRQTPELLSDARNTQSLLYAAADAGNIEATGILIEAGIPANLDESGAIGRAGTVEEIRFLVTHGADARQYSLSRLNFQLYRQNIAELVGAILDARPGGASADRDAADLLGLAIMQRRFPLAEALLERKVDANQAIYQLPLLAVSTPCPRDDTACEAQMLAIARRLIDAGANVNVVEKATCNTPLQRAQARRNTSLIELLLTNGAQERPEPSGKCRPR